MLQITHIYDFIYYDNDNLYLDMSIYTLMSTLMIVFSYLYKYYHLWINISSYIIFVLFSIL